MDPKAPNNQGIGGGHNEDGHEEQGHRNHRIVALLEWICCDTSAITQGVLCVRRPTLHTRGLNQILPLKHSTE